MNHLRRTRILQKLASSRLTLKFGEHALEVRRVTSPAGLSRGLSGIRSLPDNTGMLFVMPEVGPAHFWMRNTHIPLDIAFMDENMKVLGIQTMRPLIGTAQHEGSVKYVVETNAGWFKQHGIRAGDTAAQERG